MDKDLIERLAKRAGFAVEPDLASEDGTPWICGPGAEVDTCGRELWAFAALVAEECAKTALLQVNPVRDDSDEWHRVCAAAAENCATAIRTKFKP